MKQCLESSCDNVLKQFTVGQQNKALFYKRLHCILRGSIKDLFSTYFGSMFKNPLDYSLPKSFDLNDLEPCLC